MKMCALFLGSVLWSLCAAAQMNTVELDGLMDQCRRHMVPDPQIKQWVWERRWENCRWVEKAWDLKQGGNGVPNAGDLDKPDEINEAVSNMLRAK